MKTDAELKTIMEFANRKKELVENIFDITSRRKFLGEESEIDEFVEYLNIREPYYEQLEELNSEAGDTLRSFEIDFDNKSKAYREVSQLLSNTKDIVAQIIEIDKENNANMKRLHEMLMNEVKKINVGKKVRDSYNYFQNQGDGIK